MRRSAVLAAWLFGVGAAAGCGSDTDPPTKPPPGDETPPVVAIVFPVTTDVPFPQTDYDETGDGLLDLRVQWSDEGSGVDPATARVRVLEGANGAAGPDDDLLAAWGVARRDAAGLEAHETLAELLHPRSSRLVVSVEDAAGNEGVDTLEVILPYGAYHRSLSTGLPFGIAGTMSVCEDDGLIYEGIGSSVVVIDPEAVEILAVHSPPVPGPEDFSNSLCIPGDPELYLTERVDRFNRETKAFSEIPGTFCTDALTQSTVDPDILYVAHCGSGGVARVDKETETYLGEIAIPPSEVSDEFVQGVEVLPGDEKLYFPRLWEGGIVVADPINEEFIKRIHLSLNDGFRGSSEHIELSPDASRLYVSIHAGDPIGFGEVDTRTDELVRVIDLFGFNPRRFSLNPAGTRAFLATEDVFANIPARSVLIDLKNWRILEEFERPVPPGETEYVLATAFAPSGKVMFQTRDQEIDAFVNRE